MANDLLSVIIPVYNVEQYLQKCVHSVLSQKHEKLQVLLIDDGSTDASAKMCDDFAKVDKRVKVIHKINEGQAKARNVGLKHAQGEYIAFLDSDDYVHEEMYGKLIDIIQKNNCEVAACAIQNVDEQGNCIGKRVFDDTLSFLSREEVIEDLFKQEKVRFEVWNKVYKKELLDGVKFVEGQLYEEIGFDRQLFQKIDRYAFLNTPLHFYLTKRAGNTNSYFSEKKLCVFDELDNFIADIQDMDLPNRIVQKMETLKMNFCISLTLAAKKYKASKKVKKYLKEKFREVKKANKRNPYISKKGIFVFSISPMLYSFLLGLREKMRGL